MSRKKLASPSPFNLPLLCLKRDKKRATNFGSWNQQNSSHEHFFSLRILVLAVKRKDGLLLPFMYDIILQLTTSCMQTSVDAQGGVHYLNAKV